MNTDKTRHEVNDSLQALGGLVLLVLVLTGMSGTIYKILAPDGWIVHAFGRGLSTGVASLLALVGIVFAIWYSRGRVAVGARQRAADLVVYLFAGAGALYLGQYWLHGAL